MYILDVSTSSRPPLTNCNGLHLVTDDRSVPCQTKSLLKRPMLELWIAVFPLDMKQQASECRLCIITMENSLQQAFRGTPGLTSCTYTAFHCVLNGNGLLRSALPRASNSHSLMILIPNYSKPCWPLNLYGARVNHMLMCFVLLRCKLKCHWFDTHSSFYVCQINDILVCMLYVT